MGGVSCHLLTWDGSQISEMFGGGERERWWGYLHITHISCVHGHGWVFSK